MSLRIGMDTGPVTAGLLGRNGFVYDLWGDIANTASRMEGTSAPGCIQVTDRVYERLRDRFRFEPRGPIDVKGEMVTYLLVGRNH